MRYPSFLQVFRKRDDQPVWDNGELVLPLPHVSEDRMVAEMTDMQIREAAGEFNPRPIEAHIIRHDRESLNAYCRRMGIAGRMVKVTNLQPFTVEIR